MFTFMFMDVDFYVGVWPFHTMINHDKPWWTSGIDPLDPLSQARARRNPPTPWRLLCRSRGKNMQFELEEELSWRYINHESNWTPRLPSHYVTMFPDMNLIGYCTLINLFSGQTLLE
jgi:hypothetical protein